MHTFYNPNNSFFTRFIDHVGFGISSNLGSRKSDPNWCETLGNLTIKVAYAPVKGVKMVGHSFKDPRVVTIALTALMLLATTFAFYPTATITALSTAGRFLWTALKLVPWQSVRLAAYVDVCLGIIGCGLRAEGRFTNAALMKDFYGVPNAKSNPVGMSRDQITQLRRELHQRQEEHSGINDTSKVVHIIDMDPEDDMNAANE